MFRQLAIGLVFLGVFYSCDDSSCNDCLEIRSVEVQYLNENGDNLMIGPQAIFNPDSLIIWDKNDQPTNFIFNESRGGIILPLSMANDYFEIQPVDSIVNILEFQLGRVESEKCCGDVTVPVSINLDGSDIPNSNIITIIP